MKQDRVFDGLAQRFQRSIYADPRGMIRLAIVQDDLQALASSPQPLRVLDAGGGLGQMAIWLAQHGHQVLLAEPSAEMLQHAQVAITQAGLQAAIDCRQASVQDLVQAGSGPFDVIVFHAVLEWLAEPHAVLLQLLTLLKPGGWLSLLFFNQHSTVMRRLMAGDLATVRAGQFASDGQQGLAPISPLLPDEVLDWLRAAQMDIVTWSGVRCFYDYMYRDVRKQVAIAEVLPLERAYSQQEPWRSLARYQHVLCQSSSNSYHCSS